MYRRPSGTSISISGAARQARGHFRVAVLFRTPKLNHAPLVSDIDSQRRPHPGCSGPGVRAPACERRDTAVRSCERILGHE